MSETDDKFKKGVALAEKLFGGATVKGVAMLDKFRGYTMAHLFGDVWQGEELELAELGRLRATQPTGLQRRPGRRDSLGSGS